MPVITISREYGSGGVQIARNICELLGYSYFDKNLMVSVATEMGVSEEDVVDISEDTYQMRTFMDRLFGRGRVRSEVRSAEAGEGTDIRVEVLNEEQSISLIRDTVCAAYERDNVVIVGRGGQAILREKPGVLHVRLNAPLGARAMRVKEREDIPLSEATQLTQNKDSAAAAYLQRFFDIDWEHPMLYHITLNTGRWELPDAAQIIIDALTHLRQVTNI
ncbi:MAG: AAA family ATPase [Anaerolineae bacterium]